MCDVVGVSVLPEYERVIPQPVVYFIALKGRAIRASCWQLPRPNKSRLRLRVAEECLRGAVRAQQSPLCPPVWISRLRRGLEFHPWILKGGPWSLVFVFLVPLTL